MIPIEHKPFHLFKYDAYKEYSYSTDAYGSYQPTSFIFSCFEEFHNLALKYGLKLDYQNKSNFGYIVRLKDENQISEIIKRLEKGQNIICMFPTEEITLYYNSNNEMFHNSIKAFKKLNIEIPNNYLEFNNEKEIGYKEIKTIYKGRLFFIKDSFLSDGYFDDKFYKSDYNLKKINNLLGKFSTFNYPLLRLEYPQTISVWPCDENLQIIFKLTNHFSNRINCQINIELNELFEPLSSLERQFSLDVKESIEIPISVIPRMEVKNIKPFKISAQSINSIPIEIVDNNNFNISIIQNNYDMLKKQSKQDNLDLELLLEVFEDSEEYEDILKIKHLLDIDINSCLNKFRSIAENLANKILKVYNLNNSYNFSSAIRVIQENNILSSRAIGYFHTIRVIGNLASHPSGNKLSDIDVRIVSFALASIMEEIFEKNIF